ncbi:hypothetical protein [Roseibium sp. RKSG952]|uniref:hypothetical protein n=1 Tax=Roseibium sp. RKSG952 TaxID=2529384 RepID=UPI0013CAF878|nr:hypothetical protein [Roseibium sp. RKSG952]MTH94844.1 hypothetical protein [Roseibium sp. RKSG952]
MWPREADYRCLRIEYRNRRVRKSVDREHLAAAPTDAQAIKYCNSILNARDIAENGPKSEAVYLPEKPADLETTGRDDLQLSPYAISQMKEAQSRLENGTSSEPKRSFV